MFYLTNRKAVSSLIEVFMSKSYQLFTVLVLTLTGVNFLDALLLENERESEIISNKKYELSVCAIFKNEAKYLKEWVEYHRLIGVDHFYLYNNGSRDRSVEVLTPYLNQGLVTLLYLPDRTPAPRDDEDASDWVLSTQLPAYEHIVKYRGLNETEWLVLLDVDEFLVPVNSSKISDILENYAGYPGVVVTSDFFDASHIDVLPRRDLIIDAIELTEEPLKNVQLCTEKAIFRPECQISFTWPPYRCNFKESKAAIKVSKSEIRINKYVNRFNGVLKFGKPKEKLSLDIRLLTEYESNELFKIGYEIEDKEQAIYKFAPELRKRMGVDTKWNW